MSNAAERPGVEDPLAGMVAPRDPREGWDVPAFGSLPVVSDLDPVTTRVLAPNPSPFTLDGTNTYVLSEPGSGTAVVVDPGPGDPDHRRRVEGVLAARDATCGLVVVTHHHPDHAAAARAWARRWGCRVAAFSPDVAGPDGVVIAGGDRLGPGPGLEAVVTPGHSSDHVAFRLAHGPLLTGDHVLGRGTSVVAHPDGDLVQYLASLRRVLDLGPDALYPGHGPEMDEDPAAVVRYYLEHREFRERQILAVLAVGPQRPRALVERIYADVDRRLWDGAERSTRASLDKLAAEGRVELAPDGTVSLASGTTEAT